MISHNIKKTLDVIGWIACVLLAVVTMISGYGGMIAPDRWAFPSILAMTFPLWMMLTVLALVINLFIGRKKAILQGVTIVLCLSPVFANFPMDFHKPAMTPEEESRTFTLMSFNTFGLGDYRQTDFSTDTLKLKAERARKEPNPTLKWIMEQDADIVCAQEMYFHPEQIGNLFEKNFYDSLCVQYPYRACVFGACIFSKYPLYPIRLRQPEEITGFYNAAVAEIQGHRTLIVNVHLQSIGLDASDKELYHELTEGEGGRRKLKEAKTRLYDKLANAFRRRGRQAQLIRQQIDSVNIENVIVAGDFNDIPGCNAIRQLSKNDFLNAFTQAGTWPTVTYHANRFYFHIDHILYRGDLKAVGFRRYSFDRSDHYPIEATFLWSPLAAKVDRNLKGINLIDRRPPAPVDSAAVRAIEESNRQSEIDRRARLQRRLNYSF